MAPGEAAAGRTTYTFDNNGNQQVVQESSGNRTTNMWDYENQSTLIQKPDGSRVTMSYNPFNLRVEKRSATGATKFIWDDQNYLMETDENDAITAVYTNEPNIYGNLISQSRNPAALWLPSYYNYDALGSTRDLTDASETITDTCLYSAFGEAVAQSGSTTNPFRWVGEKKYFYDEEIEEYYIRARIFNPAISRWLSNDPQLFYHNINMSIYVNNNPVILIDASGEEPVTVCVVIVIVIGCIFISGCRAPSTPPIKPPTKPSFKIAACRTPRSSCSVSGTPKFFSVPSSNSERQIRLAKEKCRGMGLKCMRVGHRGQRLANESGGPAGTNEVWCFNLLF